jgi:antitoxin component YwqK of YwqJK toxin-antitoxin module
MDFNYKNGKETGSQRLWKPDGSIKANYEVVNGERFGLIGLKKCYTVTVDKNEIK